VPASVVAFGVAFVAYVTMAAAGRAITSRRRSTAQ
jgi:hypothetical protein